MKLKRVLVNLLLLLGTFLCCILVLEVGLWLFASAPLVKDCVDSDLGWRHIPNARFVHSRKEFKVLVSYNSFGMRDTEHDLIKPPGVFRIAVLGDSFMEGSQVPLDSVYSKVLERLLREKGVCCETLNFGVNNYGTDQEVILLGKNVFRFDPDLVIVSLVRNDIMSNFTRGICSLSEKGELEIIPPGVSLSSRVRAWLYQNSRLFVFLNIRLTKLMTAGARYRPHAPEIFGVGKETKEPDLFTIEQDLAKSLMRMYAKESDPKLIPVRRLTETLLKEIHRRCQERGVKFLLLIIPGRTEVRPERWLNNLNEYGFKPEDYAYEALDRWLLDFAAKEGIAAFSYLESFRKLRTERGINLYWEIDAHWNPSGHREAARLTVEALDSLGFLPL